MSDSSQQPNSLGSKALKADNVASSKAKPVPKKRGMLVSTGVVSFFTLISRVLGLIRDIVIAAVFGASGVTDAFFVAFKIPNFFRRLFAEGAFSQAFVPVLSEYKTQRSAPEIKQLVNRVAGSLSGILSVITVIAVIASPLLIWLFAPGFEAGETRQILATQMLQLTFPYLLLISLVAFSGAVLNSYDKFAVPAFTPILLNVSLIAAALFLAPYFPEQVSIKALAWGVLIAGVLQLAFQLPFLYRLGLLPKPTLKPKSHEGVKRIYLLIFPALIGVGVTQVNLLLDSILASFLATGSISWLYYSERLIQLPIGIFAVAIGTVILPKLSSQVAEQSADAFNQTLNWAVRTLLLIALPAGAALTFLAGPLLTTLFQYQAFTPEDVRMAQLSLWAYAPGVVGFMLIKVLAPGFYARQDTKTPVKIAVIAMVANMLLNLMLVWHLDHAGLALATTLSGFINAGLLFWTLVKSNVFAPTRDLGVWLLKMLIAVSAMLAVLWLICPSLPAWLSAGVWQRAGWLIGVCATGALSYFAVLILLGLRPRHLRA
ncbi:MAG: murein biosynthesis integral membrane protein MurJ [Pseudomonadota bacterium]|nr:murein biosynthesis integral membrane protein MurJ [Pseudomonadota bacterium]